MKVARADAERRIADWLLSLGFKRSPGDLAGSEVVLLSRERRIRLCAGLSFLTETRIDDIMGGAAAAALRSRTAREHRKDVPAAIVWIPRWSRRAEAETSAFMKKHAPDCAWGLASADGGRVMSLPGVGEIGREEPAEDLHFAGRRRDAVDLFSDANRWMLKILLLQDVSADNWGGPREPVQSGCELARLAGVSPEAAYRVVRTLESENFLNTGGRPLTIVRRGALVSRWLERDRQARPVLWHARWLYGRPKDPRDVFGESAGLSYALAGFSACDLLGILHAVAPRVLDAHVSGGLPEVLRTWSLEQVEPRDADIVLRPARFPRSVFGGRVERNGLRVADAMQAALDVANSPARGAEQAGHIVRNVLHLGESA